METKKNAGKTPDNAQKPSEKQPENVQKRVFKGEKEVHHDLYKLQVAEVVKNSSWWSSKPTFIGHEHTHMFHSIDSNGKEQFYSTNTAGHCHKVTFKLDSDGMVIPESIVVGPPVRKSKNGDVRLAIQHSAEGSPMKYDDHTHDMLYIQSEVIKVRRKNEAAAIAMSNYMNQRAEKLKISEVKTSEVNTL